ncbi:hypothetical protein [Emticicia sp. 17c]|uniref:hypothetical protein n=1 Tax=Emticicia sp. 17c TaxID=3127704 RepID=UPI00301D3621
MVYILILVISAVAQLFLPWWVIAPVAFIIAMWQAKSPKAAYLAGAGAIATLWIAYAACLNISSGGIMLERIGGLFSESLKFLKSIPYSISFFFIMALIGSQVAGFSALAGYHFRQLIK